MSEREKLIRQNFEAYRDLVWLEDLGPRFSNYGLPSAKVKELREAWNEHAEMRDWAGWQQHVAQTTDERLREENQAVAGRIETLQKASVYHQMLMDASKRQASKGEEKEIER